MTETRPTQDTYPFLGGTLIAAGMLTVLAMLHHPVVDANTTEAAVDEIIAEAPLNRLIHGAAIVLMMVQLYGFMVFRHRLSPGQTTPHLSVLLFGAGAAAMIGAALVSGFVMPALAFSFSDGGDLEVFRQLTRLAFSGNQALASFGAFALGGAGMACAWPLWRTQDTLLRLIAALGLGLAAMAGMSWGMRAGVDVLAMAIIALALCVWMAAIGLHLMFGKPGKPNP